MQCWADGNTVAPDITLTVSLLLPNTAICKTLRILPLIVSINDINCWFWNWEFWCLLRGTAVGFNFAWKSNVDQAVSCRLLTAEEWVRSLTDSRDICVGGYRGGMGSISDWFWWHWCWKLLRRTGFNLGLILVTLVLEVTAQERVRTRIFSWDICVEISCTEPHLDQGNFLYFPLFPFKFHYFPLLAFTSLYFPLRYFNFL